MVLIPFNTKSSEAEERLGRRTEDNRMSERTLGRSNSMASMLLSFVTRGERKRLHKIVRQTVRNV